MSLRWVMGLCVLGACGQEPVCDKGFELRPDGLCYELIQEELTLSSFLDAYLDTYCAALELCGVDTPCGGTEVTTEQQCELVQDKAQECLNTPWRCGDPYEDYAVVVSPQACVEAVVCDYPYAYK